MIFTVAAQEGPGIVIAHPGQDVELLCTVTGGVPSWRINNVTYTLSQLFNGQLARHNINGNNIIVEDIMMNDDRNGSIYICVIQQIPPIPDIESDPTILYVVGEYGDTVTITYVSDKHRDSVFVYRLLLALAYNIHTVIKAFYSYVARVMLL